MWHRGEKKKVFGEEIVLCIISHFFNNQNQKTLVSCLWEVPDILASEVIGFEVKKRGKNKQKHKKNPLYKPTACALYTDLSTLMAEGVHKIYRILSCSGSSGIRVLSTRFSGSLPLISWVQDPLYEHNWLCNSCPFSYSVLYEGPSPPASLQQAAQSQLCWRMTDSTLRSGQKQWERRYRRVSWILQKYP